MDGHTGFSHGRHVDVKAWFRPCQTHEVGTQRGIHMQTEGLQLGLGTIQRTGEHKRCQGATRDIHAQFPGQIVLAESFVAEQQQTENLQGTERLQFLGVAATQSTVTQIQCDAPQPPCEAEPQDGGDGRGTDLVTPQSQVKVLEIRHGANVAHGGHIVVAEARVTNVEVKNLEMLRTRVTGEPRDKGIQRHRREGVVGHIQQEVSQCGALSKTREMQQPRSGQSVPTEVQMEDLQADAPTQEADAVCKRIAKATLGGQGRRTS